MPADHDEIKVFVSSTFVDMHAERDYLNRFVFPELRYQCARRGVKFRGVDLRWGVTVEESQSGQALARCLEEIDTSRIFVALLGDRYGWVPEPDIPDCIPGALFDGVLNGGKATDKDRQSLGKLYVREEKEEGPVYVLQPEPLKQCSAEGRQRVLGSLLRFWRGHAAGGSDAGLSITHIEIKRGVFDRDTAKDHVFFYLRKTGLPAHAHFPREMRGLYVDQCPGARFKLAVLKHTIRKSGAPLHDYGAEFEGFRLEPCFLPEYLTAAELDAFADGVIQPEELRLLRDRVRGTSRVHAAASQADRFGTIALKGMEELGDRIQADLLAAVKTLLKSSGTRVSLPEDVLSYEASFAKSRTRLFLGREAELARMSAYVGDPRNTGMMVVTGAAGSGKSSLLAKFSEEQTASGRTVVCAYVGASPGSTILYRMLEGLCIELKEKCRLAEQVPEEPDKLRFLLGSFLEKAAGKHSGKLVVLIDAVNQLDRSERAHEFDWLPSALPDGVKLIVSTLPGECLERLEPRVRDEQNLLRLGELPKEQRRDLARQHLREQGKRLADEHLEALLDMSMRPDAALPLYLLVALEELCLLGLHDHLEERIRLLPGTITGLFDQILARLEFDLGRTITQAVLSWLAASRSGLTVPEIRGLVEQNLNPVPAHTSEVWKSSVRAGGDPSELGSQQPSLPATLRPGLEARSRPAEQTSVPRVFEEGPGEGLFAKSPSPEMTLRKIPERRWQQIFRSLQFYMRPFDDESSLIYFFHDQIRFAANRRYFCTETPETEPTDEYRDVQMQLVRYFRSVAEDKETPGNWKKDQPRALGELPHHLIAAEAWDELIEVLCNLRLVEAKVAAGKVMDLEQDYKRAMELFPKEGVSAACESTGPVPISGVDFSDSVERLRAFFRFVEGEGHALVQFGADPGFCIQHAYNTQAASPVGEQAEQLVETIKAEPLFLHIPSHRYQYNPRPLLMRTLEGHTGGVKCLALTGDGQRAVSGGGDKTLRIWDLETGQMLKTLQGHADRILSVVLTPDGKRAVSSDAGKELRIWDPATGQTVRELLGHTARVFCVALTADGTRAVSGSQDNTLRIWDLQTGRMLKKLEAHTSGVSCLALTPDDKLAVSGGSIMSLDISDLDTDQTVRKLQGHIARVECVALTADGKLAVTGSLDKTLRVWDVDKGRVLKKLEGHLKCVACVALTADGKIAVSGSDDKTLRVWDLETGKTLKELDGHADRVKCVALTPDAKRAVSGSDDGTLRVWDVDRGQTLQKPEAHANYVNCLALTPHGERAISGSEDGTLRIWDLHTGRTLQKLEAHTYEVNCVAVTPEGTRAVSGSDDKTLRVWDLETGLALKKLEGHIAMVYCVALTPDGKRAVSGSNDPCLRVWDLETGQTVKKLAGHTAGVYSVALTQDGKRAVSASDDHTLRVWDLETGQTIKKLEGHTFWVRQVLLTADGTRAVSASDDHTLRVWDLATGQTLKKLAGHTSAVSCLTLTQDGRRAVSGSDDHTLRVWDLETGQTVKKLDGHAGEVCCLALTPDGKWALSGSRDETLRLWDLKTGECIGRYRAHAWVRAVALDSGGFVACGTNTGEVVFLRVHNLERHE
ncbi:MAG: AAA family ATPase [Thermodesulfobacteriota bacterium]